MSAIPRAAGHAGGPCTPWGFWATVGWGVASVAAWLGAQMVAVALLLGWFARGGDPSDEVTALVQRADVLSIMLIVAAPAGIGVIALAVRLARCGFVEYLALAWPRRNDLVFGIVVFVLLLPFGDLVSYLTGHPISPRFVTETYISARDSGALLLLGLAVVLAAPLTEEVLFRGFLLPGLAERIGGIGAVLLTAGAWTAMHLQYETYYLVHVMVLGLVFGWLRLRSGSTMLTIVLHVLVNLFALVQAAAIVEWYS